MPGTSDVRLAGVSKRFAEVWAVREATFAAEAGSFTTLLGPSGCGKTTTLRLIAGFEAPDAGDILIGGGRINDTPPWRRGLGVVFQSYALFPFMSVFDNVAFGLRRHGVAAAEVRRRVGAALALVDLPGLEGRYPRQLSGGQQQRVALARALVIRPRVLLLDEPLSNLDARLRAEMRLELKRIQRGAGATTILVTHDQEEALTLSDRVLVMRAGRIVAAGSPREVWERPRHRFVADFFGVENLLPARRVAADAIRFDHAGRTLRVRPGGATDGAIVAGIRATDIEVVPSAADAAEANVVAGSVRETVYRGASFATTVATDLAATPVVVSTPNEMAPGSRVRLRLPADRIMLLADDSDAAP
jgi:ABC-type Fe3+/spermidine/putrescine transport system ATPase subunit